MKKSSQQGNVLFLVLIAVALFAALSFAATQTSRGGGQNIQKDNQRIRSTELIQYATFMTNAIMRMQVHRVETGSLCFDSPQWGHTDYNHAGCSSATNQVFDMASGGEVSWSAAPKDANSGEPWYITGQTCVVGVGLSSDANCNGDGADTSEDLVLFLPNIQKELCLEINTRLGITNPSGNPPQASGNLWPSGMPKYVGTFADGGKVDSGGSGDIAILSGRHFGCVEGSGTPPAGTYAYYHVLAGR